VQQQTTWPKLSQKRLLSSAVRDFLECTSDCVFVLDRDWRFNYLNRRAREEIARNGTDLVGTVIWDAFPEARGTEFEENYRRAMEHGEEVSFECYFAPHATWYEVTASPLKGGGIGVWFRNVNERRKWIEALETAEERFQLAARATRDLIVDWDIASGNLCWHEAHEQFLGLHHHELGSDADWLIERVHPEDREALAVHLRKAITGKGDRLLCDLRIRHADGSFAEVMVRGFVIRDARGHATRMVCAVQDNTERNQAARALREREAHLSTVFGQAMVGIMQNDPDGNIIMINKRYCEILGRPEAELCNLDVSAYTHPDDIARSLALYEEHQSICKPFQIEKRYVRPDGSSVWCKVFVSFVQDADGGHESTIAIAQDITSRKMAEQQLQTQSTLLQTVIDSVQDLIFVRNLEGTLVLANKAVTEGCGGFPEPKPLQNAPETQTGGLTALDRMVIASGDVRTIEEAILVQGQERLFETVKVPLIENETITGVIGVARDVTDSKAAEAALRASELLYRNVLEASVDCVEIIDLEGKVKLANSQALTAMDLTELKQVVGKPWVEFWPHTSRGKIEKAMVAARSGKISRFSTYSDMYKSTPKWWDVIVSPMCDDRDQVTGILAISRDTTSAREISAQLKWASENDDLTNLPNRRAFQARLQAATLRAMESGGIVGLLLIDLDHFKHINDTLGHMAGDHLLAVFGSRFKEVVRSSDFVARLGGDEFAVIVEGRQGEVDLAATGASILSRLQEPVEYDGRVLNASASLGGATFPTDASSASELFDNADIALYALKGTGRGGTKMFKPTLRDQARIISSQLSLARSSISSNAVEPHYQPQVELETGAVVGFEALMRLSCSPDNVGLPGSVAEAFKDFELASRISELMQDQVFADIRKWMNRGVIVDHVAVNAAPVEFLRDDFAERMLARLKAHGVPPRLIQLEVTETVFTERGSVYVGRALQQLHHMGVRIALDDFGTGYSSLSHLRDFPVDVVKIDRSFVDGMGREPEILAIVAAVVDLARSLRIGVVAEGVETEEQRLQLMRLGCPYGQGYLFGRAVTASKVPQLAGDALRTPLRAGAAR